MKQFCSEKQVSVKEAKLILQMMVAVDNANRKHYHNRLTVSCDETNISLYQTLMNDNTSDQSTDCNLKKCD